ncbi:hypothetical protein D9758_009258 [Tetrapyrgos nigripes]|uniref:N-acetyltransferase domain-containing protein n=1 Tax=Tetrapyrgos nigripes TaxID=182062 RepID=A0A8H5FWX3_9AGAR|nr:hypothetical protein D9758_009258 [Tetrapyrgos nigripes]
MSYFADRTKVGERVQVEALDPLDLSDGYRFSHFQLERLYNLYEELQLNCVEAGHPEQDLLTFAHRTEYFGIIYPTPSKQDLELAPSSISTKPYLQNQQLLDGNSNNSLNDELYDMLDNKEQKNGVEWDDFVWNTTLTTNSSNREHWEDKPSGSNVSWATQLPETPTHVPATGTPDAAKSYDIMGFVFLLATQQAPFPPSTVGEMTVGIILSANRRGLGFAKEALNLVLEAAFDNFKCHRIHANVLDTDCKDRVVNLFTQTRFSHEGTRRRSYYSVMEQEWKDVTCFAILDTEYVMRAFFRSAPKTMWDEMLDRHEREREALLRWEHVHLRRTSSMETLRNIGGMTPVGATSQSEKEESESASDTDGWSSPVLVGKGKGKRKLAAASSGSRSPSSSDAGSEIIEGSASGLKFRKLLTPDSDMDSDDGRSSVFDRFQSPAPEVPPSPAFSAYSSAESDAESMWSAQTTSDWDLLETSSNSGSER